MADSARASYQEAAARLLEHGVKAAGTYGRTDLADRLVALQQQGANAPVCVLVAGEYKQGKSSMVNALVGHDVCPVDDDIATTIPTAVRWADPAAAAVVMVDQEGATKARRIDVAALPAWVTEDGAFAGTEGLRLVEVGVPAEALRSGLMIVDLPGVGGIGTMHGAATFTALQQADAVLFVSDAGQELTEPEASFLVRIIEGGRPVGLVKTRTDIHPAWRSIVEADTRNARQRAMSGPVIGVSSELAKKAAASDDEVLAAESHIPALAAWLNDEVVTGAAIRRSGFVAREVLAVADLLRGRFEAERAVLDQPDRAAQLVEGLQRAEADANRLRAAASRWQQVLADSFSDLSNDLDFDLRARVRDVLHSAEEQIDAVDPATAWAEYEPQVRRTMATLVGGHYQTLHGRIQEAVERVAGVFADDADTAAELVRNIEGLVGQTASDDRAVELRESAKVGIGAQALTLLRASYGSALMVNFLGGVAGLTIAAPAMLAAGVVMGSRGFRQEKERQLAQRRTQAKNAIRKYVDDVTFVVTKESRDAVRYAQRAARDHFAARAEELVRSATAALAAAQAASKADQSERAERRRAIDAELDRLNWLADTATQVRDASDRGLHG